MLLEDKYFRKSSMIGMAWIRKWNPHNAKDKRIGSSSKYKTLHFSFVIQDHIESIGKANTIKRG